MLTKSIVTLGIELGAVTTTLELLKGQQLAVLNSEHAILYTPSILKKIATTGYVPVKVVQVWLVSNKWYSHL
jgi:hypothetical protein